MKKEILSDYRYSFNMFSGTCIQKLNDGCATQNATPNESCAFDYIDIQTKWRPMHMFVPGVVGEAPITQSYPKMKTRGFIKPTCNEKIAYK